MVHHQKTQEVTFVEKLQTALLSLSTALVIGCFVFLWNINSTLTKHDIQIEQNSKAIDQYSGQIDFLRTAVADHAVRLTKIEVENKKN